MLVKGTTLTFIATCMRKESSDGKHIEAGT